MKTYNKTKILTYNSMKVKFRVKQMKMYIKKN